MADQPRPLQGHPSAPRPGVNTALSTGITGASLAGVAQALPEPYNIIGAIASSFITAMALWYWPFLLLKIQLRVYGKRLDELKALLRTKSADLSRDDRREIKEKIRQATRKLFDLQFDILPTVESGSGLTQLGPNSSLRGKSLGIDMIDEEEEDSFVPAASADPQAT